MVLFWISSVVFAVLLAVLFRMEREALVEQRARRRALMLDAGRLTAALLMFLALPLAEPRPLATVGLGLAAFAFVAIPASWVLSLGGTDPRWELLRLQAEGAELMDRYGSPMPPEGAEKMRALIAELDRVRSAETAELCDLLTARYGDWLQGDYRPLELGRRVIRIYDLQRSLYGDEIRPPKLSEQEATYRWRLYRVFGEMIECGAAQATAKQRTRFAKLVRELDDFRRKDTAAFIDTLESSGRTWLELAELQLAWTPPAAIRRGAVPGKRSALWPHTGVFWGAILDAVDRGELSKTARREPPA